MDTSIFRYVDERTKLDEPHGWIQWKGTNVCMDIRCTCGALLHADHEFFYFFTCGNCGTTYAVGQYVKLVPLPPELVAEAKGACHYDLKDED